MVKQYFYQWEGYPLKSWSVYINVNSLYFEPFGNLSLLFQHFKLVRTYLEKTKAIIILSWTFHVHQQEVLKILFFSRLLTKHFYD